MHIDQLSNTARLTISGTIVHLQEKTDEGWKTTLTREFDKNQKWPDVKAGIL